MNFRCFQPYVLFLFIRSLSPPLSVCLFKWIPWLRNADLRRSKVQKKRPHYSAAVTFDATIHFACYRRSSGFALSTECNALLPNPLSRVANTVRCTLWTRNGRSEENPTFVDLIFMRKAEMKIFIEQSWSPTRERATRSAVACVCVLCAGNYILRKLDANSIFGQ